MADIEEPQIMTGNEIEANVTPSSEVVQKLKLSETPPITESIAEVEVEIEENEIIEDPELKAKQDKGKEKIWENEDQEQWVNMFKNTELHKIA